LEEIQMWTYSPTLCIAVGTVTCVLVLTGQVWFDKQRRTGKDYDCAIVLTGRRMMRALLAFMGMFLIEAAVRICLSPLIGFGSFARYALASVILCILLGILLVIGTVFVAPTWKTLTVFFAMLGAILAMSIASYTGADQVGYEHLLYAGVAGIGSTLVLDIVDFSIGLAKRMKLAGEKPGTNSKEKSHETARLFKNPGEIMARPIWDTSRAFKLVLDTRLHVVMLALFSAELVLLFEGLSLLFWL